MSCEAWTSINWGADVLPLELAEAPLSALPLAASRDEEAEGLSPMNPVLWQAEHTE